VVPELRQPCACIKQTTALLLLIHFNFAGPVFNTAVGIAALQQELHQKCDINREASRLSLAHITSGE